MIRIPNDDLEGGGCDTEAVVVSKEQKSKPIVKLVPSNNVPNFYKLKGANVL